MIEQIIPREMLYICDELSSAERPPKLRPIRSVDKITVGHGTAGPITKAIRKEFYTS